MTLSKKLVFLGVTSSLSMPLLAGALNSPAAPSDPSSAMFTIEDIYNRLNDGTAGAKRLGGFTEPSSEPGNTGKTLDEVMDKAPIKDDTNGAAPNDVANAKTFWGLRTDGTWGQQTGTSTAADTSSGDATAADIVFGKKAWVDGSQITGTLITQTPTCSGTLNGTRWCDNGDGTVTDMTTELIWLQKADWGGAKPWDGNGNDNAHVRAGILKAGTANASLSDDSVEGDWRLPTLTELEWISNGTEAVRSSSMRAFSGVQTSSYWSSTTAANATTDAWYVSLNGGFVSTAGKTGTIYIWPLRGGQ